MSEKTKKIGMAAVIPILYTFFVMGFCDVVGIATEHVKEDFTLNDTIANLVPSMVFLWFLLLSVPSALIMNRIGRKRMVQVSNVITILGMLIPLVSYNLVSCFIAFALLGIGNTILQVSLNPLLTNVISGDKLTSSLTAGQVVKAVSSFAGPFIAAFAANCLGGWKMIFPIYAAFALISAAWLMLTPIPAEEKSSNGGSLLDTFALLGNGKILLLTLGIVCIVGIDVGTNVVAPKLLKERAALGTDAAGFGSSIYFFARTAGAFIGAFLLTRLNDVKYFRVNIIVAIAALVALALITAGKWPVYILVAIIGFTCSCIFTVIYSAALKALPEKANEISGLMITGVCGGAVIPPLMGLASDAIGSQLGSLIIIGLCMVYCLVCSFRISAK